VLLYFKAGDLVQFRGNTNYDTLIRTRSVVPNNAFPYGIVIDHKVVTLGGDPHLAAQMTFILVMWFDPSWNNDALGLYSEEDPMDLLLIQSP